MFLLNFNTGVYLYAISSAPKNAAKVEIYHTCTCISKEDTKLYYTTYCKASREEKMAGKRQSVTATLNLKYNVNYSTGPIQFMRNVMKKLILCFLHIFIQPGNINILK